MDIYNEWTADARHEKFDMQINNNILKILCSQGGLGGIYDISFFHVLKSI
jgi:hypothetical protein